MSQNNSRKRFNSERRKSEGSVQTPGPASYNISRDICGSCISFARANRSGTNKNTSPGPGSYNISSDFGRGPKVIISKSRHSMEPPAILPGPSDYSPHYSKSSIGYSFPKYKIKDNYEKTPGPGDYDTNFSKIGPRATIGKAKRLLLGENFEGTRPILLKNKENSKGSSENIKKFEIPGPGAYDTFKPTSQKGLWTIPKAKKENRSEDFNLDHKFVSRTFVNNHEKLRIKNFIRDMPRPPRSISAKKSCKDPLSKAAYRLPSREEEEEESPTPKLSGYFAMQMIELEISLEQNCSLDLVHKLTALYTQAIEFFDDKEDPKCFDIQQRLHRMLSRPEVTSVLKSPNSANHVSESSSFEQKKYDFENRKKDLSTTFNKTLSNQTTHVEESTNLITNHTNRIQEVTTKISDSFSVQEQNLESRLKLRRKSMLNRSNSVSVSSNVTLVGECDMSGGCDREVLMQKEIEEFLEENFALQTTAVAEINVKYETEIKQFDGQGGVMALVVDEMRRTKDSEVIQVKNYYEKIRKEQISAIKKKYMSRNIYN